MQIQINGRICQSTAIYIRKDGKWRSATNIWAKVDGVWRGSEETLLVVTIDSNPASGIYTVKQVREMLINHPVTVTPSADTVTVTMEDGSDLPRGIAYRSGAIVVNTQERYQGNLPCRLKMVATKSGYPNYNLIIKLRFPNEVAYDQSISLSVAKSNVAAAATGEYILFAGGNKTGGTVSDLAEAFAPNLTRLLVSPLSVARSEMVAVSIGEKALFAGGLIHDEADAYDDTLIRTTVPPLLSLGFDMSAAKTSEHALFAGAWDEQDVTAYTPQLMRVIPPPLSEYRTSSGAAAIGEYILIAGGSRENGTDSGTVDVYNASLVQTQAAVLSVARSALQGLTVGDFALFTGGISNTDLTTVDAYNSALVRSTPTAMSTARAAHSTAVIGGQGVIVGGRSSEVVIDVYSPSLVRTSPCNIKIAKGFGAAASNENLMLYGGGVSFGGVNTDNVEVLEFVSE